MAEAGQKNILIAAGGTGGHLFPGIAIAEEIRRVLPQARINFAGTMLGLESVLLPKLGWPLVLLKSSPIKGRHGMKKLAAWMRLPFSVANAVSVMLAQKPDLLISIGGYAAGPLSIAACLTRVPFVLLEPNAVAGFTNRMIGRFSKRAFIAFEEAERYFPSGRTLMSGNPVRKEILMVNKEVGPHGNKLTIFVFGGSQGARKLNQAIVGAVKYLDDPESKIKIIHQTGASDDASEIAKEYKARGVEAEVFQFTDKIWECYEKADLVISRSGAITIAELCAMGMPSVLVPYPFAADDHQRANADSMVKIGGAVKIMDTDCTGERIANEIKNFIESPERLKKMRDALKKVGCRDAAERIVQESLKLI